MNHSPPPPHSPPGPDSAPHPPPGEWGARVLDALLEASCLSATVEGHRSRRRSPRAVLPPPAAARATLATLDDCIAVHLRFLRLVAPQSFNDLAAYLLAGDNGDLLSCLTESDPP